MPELVAERDKVADKLTPIEPPSSTVADDAEDLAVEDVEIAPDDEMTLHEGLRDKVGERPVATIARNNATRINNVRQQLRGNVRSIASEAMGGLRTGIFGYARKNQAERSTTANSAVKTPAGENQGPAEGPSESR